MKSEIIEILRNLQIFLSLYFSMAIAYLSSTYLAIINILNTITYNPVWYQEIFYKVCMSLKEILIFSMKSIFRK